MPLSRSPTTAHTTSPLTSDGPPPSAWTAYTEAPGQSETIYTTYSSTLTPQVLYDATTSSSSQTTAQPDPRIRRVDRHRHTARICWHTLRVYQYDDRSQTLVHRNTNTDSHTNTDSDSAHQHRHQHLLRLPHQPRPRRQHRRRLRLRHRTRGRLPAPTGRATRWRAISPVRRPIR